MTKVIFFTGGVYSSVGKGIILSSLGKILSECAYKVSVLKLDPYLNVNSGLLSPNEHGEVFVTRDGEETDLDLGHYERFLNLSITKDSSITAGKIYWWLLNKERSGGFNGRTVQLVPHVIDEIHKAIFKIIDEEKSDFLLIEIGGTVGDIESLPFLTGAKELVLKLKSSNIAFIHIAPTIYIKNTNEFKTKPAQHSIVQLLTAGITPDFIVLRGDEEIDDEIKHKIASHALINFENIVCTKYQKSIYLIPNELHKKKLHEKILNHFNLSGRKTDLSDWVKFTDKITEKKQHSLSLVLIGKYAKSADAYISIIESFKFASYELGIDIKLDLLNSEEVISESILKKYDAICVPYGFSNRGMEGKMIAIKYAREKNIPYFGICFGMQLACIEYARNVLNLKNANSIELDENTPHPLFIFNKEEKSDDFSTMRLGNKEVKIEANTFASTIYKKTLITPRHRHKYIFNSKYEAFFDNTDFIFSGRSTDTKEMVEIIELKNHVCFIAVQYHPEFESKPLNVEPIFLHFLKKALDHSIKKK